LETALAPGLRLLLTWKSRFITCVTDKGRLLAEGIKYLYMPTEKIRHSGYRLQQFFQSCSALEHADGESVSPSPDQRSSFAITPAGAPLQQSNKKMRKSSPTLHARERKREREREIKQFLSLALSLSLSFLLLPSLLDLYSNRKRMQKISSLQ
jgi:hypothetical protein